MLKRLGAVALAASALISSNSHAVGCSQWLFSSGGYTDTQHKILLVHGISGFDSVGGLIDYFYTIPTNLCRSGADVKVASVSAFNDSLDRGRQLAQDINRNRYGSGKFNIMAHSQGSPTARVAMTYDAAMNGYGNGRIVSVTSVDGVNKGSKIADIVRGIIPPGSGVEGGVAGLVNAFGGLIGALSGDGNPQNAIASLETLTSDGTNTLNQIHGYGVASGYCTNDRATQVTVNGNRVRLYSWAGKKTLTNVLDIGDPFIGALGLAFGFEQNDGLVSVCSQKLGYYIGAFDANHLDVQNQVLGLRYLFHDPVSVYRQHANRLKNAGL